ncbi:uncharacterized protein SOCG_02972 [Schizosaccharomyces octosporus yFS286]|uniref:Eukaryotic protein n=1 Tax=Schizosaccharomyces octosporus (strain yFS286) TaxID=483514 RepID=S9RIB8_SCHOY|nr:uncharacterized protein SOCG_02972 [Schizosaccharomyces octosporus yFS286]EPX73754.1 eukaryotic protein [Schizosaccharomyces octosporus yFS286]
MSSMKTIATHNGAFHADEALAVYMLRNLDTYRDAKVVRSRDPQLLDSCDIVVDVGGKYDGVKYFDHHQREFSDTLSSKYKTRLSSAGLVYKHFGKEVIKSVLVGKQISQEDLEILYEKIYTSFIEGLDANDNGISPFPADLTPTFKAAMSLPEMVSTYIPSWNSEKQDEETFLECFNKASEFIGSWFVRTVNNYASSWLPAKTLAREAVLRAKDSPILIMDKFFPWKSHLYDIEKELNIEGQFKYAIYSDGKGWRVQAVAIDPTSFTSRLALPEPWRGVRDEKLSELTGIPNCVFVHASGFIGGNGTYEGALEMAKRALTF